MASVITIKQEEAFRCFAENQNMYHCCLNGANIVSTIQPKTDRAGRTYIFSGLTYWEGKLIYGEKDIQKYDIAVSELQEGIGEFELLISNEEKLELNVDYFGLCQWYCYKTDDGLIVSTSYHLLLLTLKTLGIKMRLNTEKVSAGTAFFGEVMECSFTEDMDVERCIELPLYYRIVIDGKTEPVFEKTSLYDEIHSPEAYSDEAYEYYLFQIKEEIVSNVRAVLEHPAFSQVICDLSGGLDSRMVLAAAMNLPESLTEKIKINTWRNHHEDASVAAALVNAYGLKWDDIPRQVSYTGRGMYDGMMHQAQQSLNLGTYYMDKFTIKSNYATGLIKMTGGCGEALYRPWYWYMGDSWEEEITLSRIGVSLDVSHSTCAGKNLEKIIKKSISGLPGETLKEQLDVHYLYFRNRHHRKLKGQVSVPALTPLQSKTAFHCKRMYLTKKIDAKMQYDLMTVLDPLAALFPYASDEYNQNLADMSEALYRSARTNINIVPNYDIKKLENTVKEIKYIPDKQAVSQFKKTIHEWYTSESTLLSALKTLLEYSDEFEELGQPLYQYFAHDRYHKEYKNYHVENMRINRLLSVYWQIRIIGGK